MRIIRKLYRQLRPRKVETLVYGFDLGRQTIPAVAVRDTIEVETHKVDNKRRIFRALVDGAEVNRNYLYTGNLLARQLGYRRLPLVGDCSTAEQCRGRNIYPYMLTQMLHWLKDNEAAQQVLIFVAPGNIPSVKGIEKAGFKKLRHVIVYRFLGMSMYKRNL